MFPLIFKVWKPVCVHTHAQLRENISDNPWNTSIFAPRILNHNL